MILAFFLTHMERICWGV